MAYRLFDAEGRISVDSTSARRELKRTEGDFKETMARIDRMRAEADITADITDVEAKMQRAHALMRKFERERAEATTDVETANATQKMYRVANQLRRLDGRRAKLYIELDQRGVAVAKELERMDRALGRVSNRAGNATPHMNRLGKALNQARITLGPISVSLRALAIGLTLAGPMVLHLVGALTSLAGILSTGIVGAAGLAGAALSGAGLIAVGMFSSIKANAKVFEPLKRDAAAFGKEWGKLTQAGATGFARGLQASLGNVEKMLPRLAARTNTSFAIMSAGAQRFTKMLASTEGQGNLDKIFGNANKALAPLLRAMTNLGQVGLRVFASFSRHLAPLAQQFEGWSEKLLNATDNTGRLDRGVDRVVRHARLVGRFFLEAGRAVRDVFNAAAGEGEPILKSMADSMRDVQTWARSAGAQDFFQRAREGAAKIANVLGEILPLIGKWFTAMEPFSNAFLDVVTAAGKLANAILNAAGGGEELIRVLAGLYIIRKAAGWAGALRTALAGATLGALVPFGKKGKGAPVPVPAPVPTGGDKAGRSWSSRFLGGVKAGLKTAGGQIAAALGLGKVAQVVKNRWGAKVGTGLIAGLGLKKIGPAVSRALSPATLGKVLSKGSIWGTVALAATKGATQLEKGINKGIESLPEKVKPKVKSAWEGIGRYLTPVGPLADLDKALGDPGAYFDKLKNAAKSGIDKVRGFFGADIDGPKIKAPKIPKLQPIGSAEILSKVVRDVPKLKTRLELEKPTSFNAAITKTLTAAGRQLKAIRTVRMRVQIFGDKQAQLALNRLKRTEPGRKLLQIIERGGKPAIRLLSGLNRTRVGRKLLQIIERGGKPAERVLSRLSNKKLARKVQQIIERGGSGVERRLAKILGIRLTQKTQQVGERGAGSVGAKIAKIAGMKLGNKSTTLSAVDRASGVVSNVLSLLSSVPRSITSTVTTFFKKVGKAVRGAGGAQGGIFGYARGGDGGEFGGQPVKAAIAREAFSRPPVPEGGAIVREPRVLQKSGAVTGEERRKEIVISTNPQYKNRNVKLLGIAADALGFAEGGISGFAAGGVAGFFPDVSRAVLGSSPGKVKSRKPAFYKGRGKRARKRQSAAIKVGGAWQARINSLQAREEDLEREAQIRESMVREPDTFLRQVGTTPDGSPIMALDQDAINRFTGSQPGGLGYVQQIYNLITQVVTELNRVLPQAIKAQQEEIKARTQANKGHQRTLRSARAALGREQARKGKRRRPGEIKRLQRLINSTENKISKNGTEIGDGRTLIRDWTTESKDSGFRIREAAIRAQTHQLDINAVQGRAEKDLKDSQSTAGDAGGPSTNLPVQLAALGSARYDLLANYGGNMAPAPGGAAGAMLQGFSTGGVAVGALGDAIAAPMVQALGNTGGGDTTKTINVTNNYQGAPEDAMSWAQRQKFEISASGF